MKGLVAFVIHRSVAAILTLAVIVAIIVAVLQFGQCGQIDATLARIRQQLEQEIIDNKMVFKTPEESQTYIDMRMQQEKARLGLDMCA